MNPGVKPYYGTPDTLGVPPIILRDLSLRVFMPMGLIPGTVITTRRPVVSAPEGVSLDSKVPATGTRGWAGA